MNVSKDPRIIQYANTITGMPEYHIMKTALEEVFGEDEKVSFENIDSMRKVIREEYVKHEYGLLTSAIDDLDLEETKKELKTNKCYV